MKLDFAYFAVKSFFNRKARKERMEERKEKTTNLIPFTVYQQSRNRKIAVFLRNLTIAALFLLFCIKTLHFLQNDTHIVQK